MTLKRKSPGANGAEVSLQSDFAKKIVSGQIKNGYVLELSLPATDNLEPRTFLIGPQKAARSLLILYMVKMGMTRAEALSDYFVLSLTQHVFKMRHDWGLKIKTELVQPSCYGRYHLVSPVTIRILKAGE